MGVAYLLRVQVVKQDPTKKSPVGVGVVTSVRG